MTEDEEKERYRYLQLKQKMAAAQAAAAPAPKSPEREAPGRAASALAGVQNLGTLGWGDELGAALQGALAKASGTGEFGDTYRQARDENRRESAAARKGHPGYYYGAGAPAAVASSMAMPAVKAAQGAGLGVRALVGLANGAAQGAVAGAGDSEADTLGGVGKDALVGGGVGGVAGGVLPVVGAAAKGLGSRLLNGVVKAGPVAQTLEKLGVDTSKFTLGQLNPEGAMAQMEEAGQHAIGSGKVIEHQREAGTQAWRDAVLSRSTAPYNALTGEGGTAEKLAAAYEGFKPAYKSIGAETVTTAGPGQQSMGDQLRKAFRRAVSDESVLATDADRKALGGFLKNEASAVHFKPGESSTVGDLQAVRSSIRSQAEAALAGANPNHAQAKLLANAEEAVTAQIEANLPKAQQSALRGTDARYASHMTVSDAVRRAGDNAQGLMPKHLSSAVQADMARGAYARGGGGDLRELAKAGAEALQTKTPPTGVRALMQLVPGSHYVQSPIAAIANTGGVKRALLGQTEAQRSAQALVEALMDSGAAKALSTKMRPTSGAGMGELIQLLSGGAPRPSVSPGISSNMTPEQRQRLALGGASSGDFNL